MEEAPAEGAEDSAEDRAEASVEDRAEDSAEDRVDFTIRRHVITDRFSEADGFTVRIGADGAAVAAASADFSECSCFRSSSSRSWF